MDEFAMMKIAILTTVFAFAVSGVGAQTPKPDSVPPHPDSVPQHPDTVPQRRDSVPQHPDSSAQRVDSVPHIDTVAKPIVTVRHHVDSAVKRPAAPPVLWLIDNYPLMRARLDEISGRGRPIPIVRSTSSMFWSGDDRADGVYAILPQMQLVTNSKLPYSRNDGGLWAGKGLSMRLSAGVALKMGLFRVILAPELLTTENDSFPPRADSIIPAPIIPANRSKFAYPWYANGPYSLDMPLRFGDKGRDHGSPGQSSVLADFGMVSFGVSTENEWWGPGIDNALIMSNNAAGFPHLLLASSHPLQSIVGDVEFRWLVGGLRQSSFFDTSPAKMDRSISAAVVSIRPRGLENLSVGLARAVIGTSTGWSEIPLRWLEVLHGTGHPNDGEPYDSTLYPGGRDQLYSVFGRWVFPASGVEIYGEWGRLDLPRSFQDLFQQPNRGLAYTLGLQWTGQAFTPGSRIHLRAENTSLEQNLAERNRFAGVWYTSRRVLQGFTNEGEVLGAAVGPGSSGQAIELNYLLKTGYFGFNFQRTRYNEDVHQAAPILDYLRWCSHDVGLQWGIQGGVSAPIGTVSVRGQFQNRLNAFFQSGHGCPRSQNMEDKRNNNFVINVSPGLHF